MILRMHWPGALQRPEFFVAPRYSDFFRLAHDPPRPASSKPPFPRPPSIPSGALAYAVRVPSCSWLGSFGLARRRRQAAIALTFDDGPSESTAELLEILARYHAPASFFQCGAHVRRLPSVASEVASAGHEIGNHSDQRNLAASKSPGFIHRELSAAQDAIENATSIRPRYFRSPYGARWFGLRAAQQRLGLQGVMWSVLALDWKMQTAAVVSRLLQGATGGAILCLHDGRALKHRPDISVTLQAVRELVQKLMEQGFHFEKVIGYLMSSRRTSDRASQSRYRGEPSISPRRRSPPTVPSRSSVLIRLDGINILFAVESEFNINIPDDAARNLRSVRDVIDGIAKLLSAQGDKGNQATATA